MDWSVLQKNVLINCGPNCRPVRLQKFAIKIAMLFFIFKTWTRLLCQIHILFYIKKHQNNTLKKNKISIKHLIQIINLGAKNCPVGRNGLKLSGGFLFFAPWALIHFVRLLPVPCLPCGAPRPGGGRGHPARSVRSRSSAPACRGSGRTGPRPGQDWALCNYYYYQTWGFRSKERESERIGVFQVFQNMGSHFKNCHKKSVRRLKRMRKRADQRVDHPFEPIGAQKWGPNLAFILVSRHPEKSAKNELRTATKKSARQVWLLRYCRRSLPQVVHSSEIFTAAKLLLMLACQFFCLNFVLRSRNCASDSIYCKQFNLKLKSLNNNVKV